MLWILETTKLKTHTHTHTHHHHHNKRNIKKEKGNQKQPLAWSTPS